MSEFYYEGRKMRLENRKVFSEENNQVIPAKYNDDDDDETIIAKALIVLKSLKKVGNDFYKMLTLSTENQPE